MTRRLLIGTDGSARSVDAIAAGALLAPILGAEPVLLYAHPHAELATLLEAGEREQMVRSVVERSAGQAERWFGRSDAAALSLVADRSPAAALHAAAEDGVAAIVVGSSHRGPIGRVLPGGTAERLLMGAPCPVVVAPAGYAARQPLDLGRIACGFDGSAESHSALRAAADLARTARAPLVVIAVHQRAALGPLSALRDRARAPANRRRREDLVRQLEFAFAGTGLGEDSEAVLLEGEPATELAKASADPGLLVVGSRGHGPAGSVLAGSVATKLLRTARCPLMIVPRSDAAASPGSHSPP